MSGLLTALNAGKTSLMTNQKSIEIVGNNIANVNTCLLYTSPSPRD